MSETTGFEAKTIHRLLKFNFKESRFEVNRNNPLDADVIIIDEASMVDLALMSTLVQAIPLNARLILLGDKDQLASVKAGSVLGDICDTGKDHGISGHFSGLYQQVAGEKIEKNGDEQRKPVLRDSIIPLKRASALAHRAGSER